MSGEIIGSTTGMFGIAFTVVKIGIFIFLIALAALILWYSISSIINSFRNRKRNQEFDDYYEKEILNDVGEEKDE